MDASAFDAPLVIGEGAHRYRFERNWAKLPRWWSFGSTTPADRNIVEHATPTDARR